MSVKPVSILDYGVGNLLSVSRAFEKCGGKCSFITQPKDFSGVERLVIPGVGAFSKAMSLLRERELIAPIQALAAAGRPVLGICLGMQMLLDFSEEFGFSKGLSLVKGGVKAIPRQQSDGAPQRIPHIGWSDLHQQPGQDWERTILEKVAPGSAAYFVHSFQADTENRNVLAFARYGGRDIPAVIHSEKVFGCQFHPEKSGPVGLQILESFLQVTA